MAKILLATIVYRAREQPMTPGTPRLIYRAFEIVYNICYVAAVSGFVIVMFEFFTAFFILMHLEIVPITALVVLALGTSKKRRHARTHTHARMQYVRVSRKVGYF